MRSFVFFMCGFCRKMFVIYDCFLGDFLGIFEGLEGRMRGVFFRGNFKDEMGFFLLVLLIFFKIKKPNIFWLVYKLITPYRLGNIQTFLAFLAPRHTSKNAEKYIF